MILLTTTFTVLVGDNSPYGQSDQNSQHLDNRHQQKLPSSPHPLGIFTLRAPYRQNSMQ